jgi:hypothetical protein
MTVWVVYHVYVYETHRGSPAGWSWHAVRVAHLPLTFARLPRAKPPTGSRRRSTFSVTLRPPASTGGRGPPRRPVAGPARGYVVQDQTLTPREPKLLD